MRTNSKTYSPDEIAQLRATRILLNDPVAQQDRALGFSNDYLLESHIAGSGRSQILASPIPKIYAAHKGYPVWKDFARLIAVYLLKSTGTIENILELKFGPVKSELFPVSFRGRRRRRYSNEDPAVIEFKGKCPLE